MHDENKVLDLVELTLMTGRTPEDVCSDHPELLAEVQRRWRRCCLVDAELKGIFPETLQEPICLNAPPPNIPGYVIDAPIGFGGMGVVYKARQTALQRDVAIKMLLAGDFATSPQRTRFLREAEAIAGLSHPSIVKIYDYGHCEGRPYYAMEYVNGQNLAEKLAECPLSAIEAARLTRDVADAMHHAHKSRIIHRDLKPANLLLTSLGEIKVTDFGVARLLDRSSRLTLTGDALGTPNYMAPEQANGTHEDVGAAADIYSIGAVLYEMLTGNPPFQANTAAETQRLVIHEEPVLPSRHNASTPLDLQTICMKCLEKAPERRYHSAEALANDLRSCIAGQPITAQPINAIEKLRRWTKRNQALAIGIAAVSILVLSMLVLSTIAASHFRYLANENGELAKQKTRLAMEADAQRGKAVEAEKIEKQLRKNAESLTAEIQQMLYLTEMNLTSQSAESPGGMGRLFERLAPWDTIQPDVRDWEWGYLNGLLNQSESVLSAHAQGVQHLAFNSDGDQLLTVGGDHRACIWNVARAELQCRFIGHTAPVQSGAWSPSGELVVTADRSGGVCIWNPKSCELVFRWQACSSPLNSVAWSPNGQWIVTGGNDRMLRVWDALTGSLKHEMPGHTDRIIALDFNMHSHELAACGFETTVRVWDIEGGIQLASLEGHQGWVSDVRWSPDGERLASSSADRSAIIWDLENRKPALRLEARSLGVKCVTWSPDGTQIATGGDDQTTRIWSALDGSLRRTLRGHSREVGTIDWNHTLATGGVDGDVRIWTDGKPSKSQRRIETNITLRSIEWSPIDDRLFVAGGVAGQMLFCFGEEVKDISVDTSAIQSISWKPTGEFLATLSQDGTVRIWDVASKKVLRSLKKPDFVVLSIAWSPDRHYIAGCGTSGKTCIWQNNDNLPTEIQKLQEGFASVVSWSPDGSLLAVASSLGTIKLYKKDTWQLVREIRERSSAAKSLAWSPDGSQMAVAAHQGAIEIWRVSDGERVAMLHGNRTHPTKVVWSPNGRRISTAANDGSIRIWDVESEREVIVFSGQEASSRVVGWNCDGFALAICGASGGIDIYNAWDGFFEAKSSHILPRLDREIASRQEIEDLRTRGLIYARLHDEVLSANDLNAYLTKTGQSWIIADCYVAGPDSTAFELSGPFETIAMMNSNSLIPPREISWTRVILREHGFINFGRLFDGKTKVSGYVFIPVYCVKDQDVVLHLGSDDQMRLWVNNRQVYEISQSRNAIPNQDQVDVRLRAGWNQILVRVANDLNNHILYFEIDDRDPSIGIPVQTVPPPRL